MISICYSNILTSKCDILVNPVNCFGVMGAGLAKQFARQYPEYEQVYKELCNKRSLKMGEINIYHGLELPCIGICSLPTKYHWRDKSRLEPITKSCKKLREYLDEKGYSCAIPALGCGLGGLDFAVVKDMIYTVFNECKSFIEFYAPGDFAV